MAFLSVIVPIYNAEKYLNECLDSIVNQTYRDFELILVNDGSTDSSPEICNQYAQKYDFIKIVNKSNGGLVSARKAGLREACGDYIGWVDADDAIVPEMFEKMCNEVNNTQAEIVVCDMWSWSGNKLTPMKQAVKESGLYEGERLEKDFQSCMLYADEFYTFGILPAQFNKIVKSSIIKRNMDMVDDRITIGEDAACTYFCMLDAKKISYLKGEYLYKYRANLNSMCFQWKSEKIQSASVLLNYMYKRIKEYQNSKVTEQFWYYLVCIYTNVYFEYGVYSTVNKKKIELISEKICLNTELEHMLIEQIKNKNIRLPYDRKLVMEIELCKENSKKRFTLFVMKIRCWLMVMYRRR